MTIGLLFFSEYFDDYSEKVTPVGFEPTLLKFG